MNIWKHIQSPHSCQAHDISTPSSKMRFSATSSSFLATIEHAKKHSLPIITYKCCDKRARIWKYFSNTISCVSNVIPTPEIPQPAPGHFPNIPGLIQFQEYSRVSTAATDQANSFWLKWLPGTRVSRCYGCNREIVNHQIPYPTTWSWRTETYGNTDNEILGNYSFLMDPKTSTSIYGRRVSEQGTQIFLEPAPSLYQMIWRPISD